MEAPRRKKAFIIAAVVVFAVVVVAAIAIGVAVGLRNGEPPAPSEEQMKLSPKVLPYDQSQIVEDGHWNFLMDTTGKDRIEEVYHDFETKPGTNWTITGTFDSVGVFSMKCTKDILEKEALPLPHMQSNVIYVEPVYKRSTSRATNLYGLDRLDQANAVGAVGPTSSYDVPGNLNGAGVTVYVLDTGIRATHSQFAGRMAAGQDFVGDGQGTNDCNGHGTHCAGTIAGATFGVANGAKVAPVRVLGCDGSGSSQGVINGINWVTANARKPAVGSMSLGGGRSATENNAVERAVAAGIPFAVAAGNENADACNTSPASATNALTVGASDINDRRASFSNWGTCLDVFAPGVNIKSAGITNDNAEATLSGTSMACPHVAGVMALTLQKTPTLSGVGVNNAIIAGSLAGKVADPRTGSPNRLLNVNFLATAATPAPAPVPAPTPPAPAPSPPAGQATAQGTLTARGQVQFHPNGRSFRTTTTKALSATLVGPGGNVDYDLALMRFFANQWIVVAESIGATSREAITSTQPAGDYTWRVLNFNGAGAYTITFTNA